MNELQQQLLYEAGEDEWGTCDERRGSGHQDMARDFLATFPIGHKITTDRFDQWAYERGHLKMPSDDARDSDSWKAHIYDRNRMRKKLNKAAAHSRMEQPFALLMIQKDWMEVVPAHEAPRKSRSPKRAASQWRHVRIETEHWYQAVHWKDYPPYMKALALNLYATIKMLEDQSSVSARHYFQMLEDQRKTVESYDKKRKASLEAPGPFAIS
jgi:hypothetical protein